MFVVREMRPDGSPLLSGKFVKFHFFISETNGRKIKPVGELVQTPKAFP